MACDVSPVAMFYIYSSYVLHIFFNQPPPTCFFAPFSGVLIIVPINENYGQMCFCPCHHFQKGRFICDSHNSLCLPPKVSACLKAVPRLPWTLPLHLHYRLKWVSWEAVLKKYSEIGTQIVTTVLQSCLHRSFTRCLLIEETVKAAMTRCCWGEATTNSLCFIFPSTNSRLYLCLWVTNFSLSFTSR